MGEPNLNAIRPVGRPDELHEGKYEALDSLSITPTDKKFNNQLARLQQQAAAYETSAKINNHLAELVRIKIARLLLENSGVQNCTPEKIVGKDGGDHG